MLLISLTASFGSLYAELLLNKYIDCIAFLISFLSSKYVNEPPPFQLYAFSNDTLQKINISELKTRITKLIAEKLGVELGFEM